MMGKALNLRSYNSNFSAKFSRNWQSDVNVKQKPNDQKKPGSPSAPVSAAALWSGSGPLGTWTSAAGRHEREEGLKHLPMGDQFGVTVDSHLLVRRLSALLLLFHQIFIQIHGLFQLRASSIPVLCETPGKRSTLKQPVFSQHKKKTCSLPVVLPGPTSRPS